MMWRTIRRNVLKDIVHHFSLGAQRPVSSTWSRRKSVNNSMSLISRTVHLMQLPVMMSKNILRVVKSGIGFHNFRHNNIQILNFNFKIHASNFFLFVECLIVHGRGYRIRAIGSEESPSHSQRTAG